MNCGVFSCDYPPPSLALADVAFQESPFPRIPSQSRSLGLRAHQDSSYDHSKESTAKINTYVYPKRYMMRNLHDISLPWRITAVAHFRRSHPNETEPKINRPNWSDCCSIGSVIKHNRTGTFRRVRLIDYRTQWNLIDAISSILFGRKTNRIQFELNRKDLPLVCMRSTLK